MEDLEKISYDFRKSREDMVVFVIRKRTVYGIMALFLIVGCVPFAVGTRAIADKLTRKTCKEFSTYAEAKALFDSNPQKYKYLDGDNDKMPCESLIR